jgi:hypothetical protein
VHGSRSGYDSAVNVARIMREPVRVGSLPAAFCYEAIAMTKDVFVAAEGVWSLVARVIAETTTWPTERAYAAAATDYVLDARRVIDALRWAAEDDREVSRDPLASAWDDVVRRPHTMGSIGLFGSVPAEERNRPTASSA